MARTKISEFSATPAENTDIDNIDIAEGCAPSGINNAIRELMSQLKDMQTGASGDAFTLTTVNSTTVDTTNLEATNLKAKDGTAAGSIANSTGVVTLASTVLTTTDINGGTIDATAIGASTPSTVVATQVDITAQGDLRLQDTTGGQYVALQAPSTVASSYTLTLPVDDGTSGQALITDGSGALSWSSAASGDVYGPASAADNAVARYDGTTGKIIQNSAVTIADDGATVIAANSTTDGLRITQTGTGNALLVEDSANPDGSPFVINNSGTVVSGYTAAIPYSLGFVPFVQGNYTAGAAWGISRWSNDTTSPRLSLAKSRGAAVGTRAIALSGDDLGTLVFEGDDGAAFIRGAQIVAQVDGTPGTNDMPGRLVFATTADGASSPTERMRIDNAGQVGIGGAAAGGRKVDITGTLPAVSGFSIPYSLRGTIPSGATTAVYGFYSTPTTEATAFTLPTLTHFFASPAAFGASSVVTNQYGFHAGTSLTGATNNYGFYGNIASGTGRWNFYAAGNADNYFAGNVGIGRAPPTVALDIFTAAPQIKLQGTGTSSDLRINAAFASADLAAVGTVGGSPLMLFTFNTERMRIASTGTISLGASPGAESLRVTPVASAVNYWNMYGAATSGFPTLQVLGSDTNIGLVISAKGTSPIVTQSNSFQFLNTSGQAQFLVASTASAVDYLQVTGSTAGYPVLSAQGSSANIVPVITSKGTGAVILQTGGVTQVNIAHTASGVNFVQLTGSIAGSPINISAQGSDTNIDLALTPKGTGRVRFGTLTANADEPITGYIEVKDSAGNVRKLAVIA